MLEAASSHVTLRPACEADCRRLWEWRNEPSIRAVSFHTEPISYEEHQRWFAQKLRDSSTRIFIALDVHGEAVGYVRFKIAGPRAEISVAIDHRQRAKGYGASAIQRAAEHLLSTGAAQRIVAQIRSGNPASLRAFQRAGFLVRPDASEMELDTWEAIYEGRPMTGGSVLIRVEASPSIGLGHLQRSLSLASALQELNTPCVFLTNGEPAVRNWLMRFGFESKTVQSVQTWDVEDAKQTAAFALSQGCQAVVVDSDHEGAEFLSCLRAAGLFVCAIEDLAPHPFPCHVVVNGDAHASRLRYMSSSGDTRFLLGPAYCILRKELWVVPPRVVRETPQHVLVMLGGNDPHHLMPGLLQVVGALPKTLTVTVVIGPFFDHVREIEEMVRGLLRPVKLVYAPDSVCELMMEADLAVSAGGQTLYELARVGCPAIAIRVAENQDGQLAVLEELGVIQFAGHAEDRQLLATMDTAIHQLLSDPRARSSMIQAGQRLVDGQGALRVARALGAAVSRGQRATRDNGMTRTFEAL